MGLRLRKAASTPGSTLPSELHFASYATKTDPRLLLHSSDHNTIDYTAVETRTTSTVDSHLKHYVAVYDPVTNNLTVVEARNVAARPQIRQYENEAAAAKTSTRVDLVESFGTKKSKKAAQARAENRLFARGGDEDEPLSQAINSSVAVGEADAPAHDTVQSNKPLPRHNLDTEDIREVYSLDELVFPSGASTLRRLPIAYWTDRMSKNKGIRSTSQFVSNRAALLFHVQKATDPSETQAQERIKQQIHLLRYLELLLQMHRYLASMRRGARIQPVHRWPEKTIESDIDTTIVSSILQRIFADNSTSTFAVTLLRTTILAITLHIPPAGRTPDNNMLVAEPTDISRDLSLEREELHKLYRELGCKLSPMNETEMSVFGLNHLKGAVDANGEPVNFKKVKFAKLRFPIEFPKVSQGRRDRKRQ